MSKKILSALLVLTLLVTSFSFMGIVVNAEETVWAVGDKPYAVVGGKQKPIVVSAAEGEFYDDFVVPNNFIFENFTSVFQRSFQLNNNTLDTNTTTDGNFIVSAELATADENGINENAYGGVGNSVKVQTSSLNNIAKPLADGTRAHYNSVRTNGWINLTNEFPSFDNIAISFWVKTEGPAQYSVAFWDTTTTTGQKLHSDAVNIPDAGEYIVTIPLQNFYVSNTAYKKAISISQFTMFGLEVMFKAAEIEADEKLTMYFDNIGLYAVMPNYGTASHTAAAVVKDNMDDYTDSTTGNIVNIDSQRGDWASNDNTLSLVEHADGKALQYKMNNYKYAEAGFPSPTNRIYTNSNNYTLDLVGKDGTNLGKDGTLAFWVKASRASRVRVRTVSSNAWYYSDVIVIPAGESIVRVPFSVYYNQDNKFKEIKKLQIDFCGIAPLTNNIGGIAGTFIIDDIAIEPTVVEGDTNGDKVCDAIDVVRIKKLVAEAKVYAEAPSADIYPDKKLNSYDAAVLRSYLLGNILTLPENAALIEEKSFVEVSINSSKWVNQNKSKPYTTISTETNATRYYGDSDDTTALKVTYTNLDSVWSNGYTNFYLNQTLRANDAEPYNFGSDTVFAFWVYSEQSVNLRINYLDRGLKAVGDTTVSNLSCTKLVTIPAGESIIRLDMSELAPVGSVPNYQNVYQLQFHVYKNNDSTSTDGVLYLDNFGFYDKDTTNAIPAVAE